MGVQKRGIEKGVEKRGGEGIANRYVWEYETGLTHRYHHRLWVCRSDSDNGNAASLRNYHTDSKALCF